MSSQTEQVNELIAITGASEQDAQRILSQCGYSLERAAEYYFQRDSLQEEERSRRKNRVPRTTAPVVCPTAEELADMFPIFDIGYLALLVRKQGHDGDAIIRRLIRESQEEEAALCEDGPEDVFLNVYNLAPEKEFLTKVGLGVYHSGIEIYGREWSFGGSCDEAYADYSGIFHCEPKSATPHFFKRVKLGTVRMSHRSVYFNVIKPLQETWTTGSYHLIQRNCNHFSAQLAAALEVKAPPSWVNRSARIGDTMIPMRVVNYFINGNTPPQQKTDDEEEREKRLSVGSNIKLCNPMVLPSKSTGHTNGVCVSSLTKGIKIIAKKKGSKVLLQFPRQHYQDADTGATVLVGPFEHGMHIADIDPTYSDDDDDDDDDHFNPAPQHDLKVEDVCDNLPEDNYDATVQEVIALLPLHPVPLVRECTVKHRGNINKIVEELLG
eukprot:TRINITY_DN286_c9_g1_i1.p1 TRINITY_DN286_c9_g1~~TRINITY_DN286_c9_g1_i1.p1  ORF type:complete len:438 (+),score=66.32 TRINITY_DN286_c9_g1_i1:317-1630(+)